jgi:ribbon-helix-helix CopG family protein
VIVTPVCDHEVMAKEKTTLYLDEDVLRQAEAAAAGSGRDESELVEDALRRYLGLEVVERVWTRNAANALDSDEALALAYAELKSFRAERDSPAA